MTRGEKRALVERLHEVWNTGDLEAVPDVYASDFVVHWPRNGDPSKASQSRGHDGAREAIRQTRVAFPDWHENVVDMIIDGDRVVTRYVSTGTHEGPYEGVAPTGASVEIDEISIFRIEGGKVAEQWCLIEDLAFWRQLGR